jgi:hypothetical protein
MRITGAVVSEQERIVARTRAPAALALKRLKNAENPVERRIVTLMKRVTM